MKKTLVVVLLVKESGVVQNYVEEVQRNATVCRYLFTAKLLYMFRTSIAPIIRSTKKCSCSLWEASFFKRHQIRTEMQQYADIYLLLNYSTCFGRPSRPLSGVHKIVVIASGTDHTIWEASFFKRHQIRTLFGDV